MSDKIEGKLDKVIELVTDMRITCASECEKNKNHRESKMLHLGGYLLTTGVIVIYLLKTFL